MKHIALAAVLLAGCAHPWRTASIVNGAVAGVAAICAFDCGPGAARDTADVVLVIEAVLLAAILPPAATLTFTAEAAK